MKCLVYVALLGLAACDILLGGQSQNDKREIVIGMPGGIYEADLDDPATREAVKQALGEFKRRAINSGKLGSSDVVVVGELVKVETQVVAGQKFIFTIKLGITSNANCRANSDHLLVSAKLCTDTSNVGTHKVEVISQPWMDLKYQFTKFEDVDGPELKSIWEAGAN